MAAVTSETEHRNRPPDRYFEDLDVVDFVPLAAGWRNVYRGENDEQLEVACPGVLRVRVTGITRCWDVDDASGGRRVVRDEVTYTEPEVRFVFATRDGVELRPANEDTNYVSTLGPGESQLG